MKERLSKRCLAAFFAVMATLVMSFASAVPAFADNVPVSGGTFTFNKYLVMEEHANVPNVTFGFTIAAGDPVSESGKLPISAGADPASVVIDNVDFSLNESGSINNGKPDDPTAEGYKYATKEVSVNFGNVNFPGPGIYRYLITETGSAIDGIVYDPTVVRTLDVYVVNADDSDNPQLKIDRYVMYSGDEKSNAYTNEYIAHDVTLSKKVTGNQGDHNKAFEFTVKITKAREGAVYVVDLPGVDDGRLEVGSGGIVEKTYQLKHGESLIIRNLDPGVCYTIEEKSYSDDGYTTSNDVAGPSNTTGARTMDTEDHAVVFTNHRQGAVPTGVLLETAPYIGLGAAVLVGLVLLFVTRRHRESE